MKWHIADEANHGRSACSPLRGDQKLTLPLKDWIRSRIRSDKCQRCAKVAAYRIAQAQEELGK